MKTLQDILDRYEGKIDKQRSIIGYLMWGGKGWYKINSNKPLNLNSTFEGFILNDQKQVQEFKTGKVRSVLKWGKTLDKYYPWPYFPKKKVKAWEVVRIMPFHFEGDIIDASEINTEYCLNHPEFYKPLY